MGRDTVPVFPAVHDRSLPFCPWSPWSPAFPGELSPSFCLCCLEHLVVWELNVLTLVRLPEAKPSCARRGLPPPSTLRCGFLKSCDFSVSKKPESLQVSFWPYESVPLPFGCLSMALVCPSAVPAEAALTRFPWQMSRLLGAGDAPGVPIVAEGMEGEAPSRVERNTFVEERGYVASHALH